MARRRGWQPLQLRVSGRATAAVERVLGQQARHGASVGRPAAVREQGFVAAHHGLGQARTAQERAARGPGALRQVPGQPVRGCRPEEAQQLRLGRPVARRRPLGQLRHAAHVCAQLLGRPAGQLVEQALEQVLPHRHPGHGQVPLQVRPQRPCVGTQRAHQALARSGTA